MTQFDDEEAPQTIISTRGLFDQAAPDAEAMGHYLVIIGGTDVGRLVEVGAEPISIGRGANHKLAFPADSEMSRLHARVRLENGAVIAEDAGSTNGTFLDGTRLAAPVKLREGQVLRLGKQSLKYARRMKADVKRAQDLDKDLARANNYVQSLLPVPISTGPVQAEWSFVPSAKLGGDAFGYDWLDERTFVFYLMDVAGHGVGSAMHSVAVMNVLRQRALPRVDFASPAAVLASLNDRFGMDTHNGLYFTMWYGVFKTTTRTLVYGAAGHHAAYLVEADRRQSQPLGSPNLMIGAIPGMSYDVQQTTISPGSKLYLFSDGVFEVIAADGRQWALADFVPLLAQPIQQGISEPNRLYQAVRQAARPGPFDDDFSLVTVTFQ